MKKLIPFDAVLVPDNAELAFSGMIFDVYQWDQELFDGSHHRFEMLKRTDTVNAICIVDDKILVLDDEQPHLGSRRSFPGGRIDDTDESQLVAAQREIHEETGYTFKNWRLVKVSQPYRKIEWFVYTFMAWDVESREEPHLDPGEKIVVNQLEFAEVKSEVVNGEAYLGESQDLFKNAENIARLLNLAEFQGQQVDR